MISQVFVGILFLFFFLPFKLYFLWINYKGRFRYGLWEHGWIWRKLDKWIGVWSIVIDFMGSIWIIMVLSAVLISLLDITTEVAMSLVLFGAIGWTFVNMAVDEISVKKFEKNCLQCQHKKECMNFHKEKCISEPIKQLSKSAILYEEKLSKKENK